MVLPEHVELPHVLDLTVHLVQLTTWMGRGGHTETFPSSTFSLEHFFTPNSHVFLVSAQVPIGPSDLGLLRV